MELKEVGLAGVFVVGGAVAFGSVGLNDVLSEDLRHVAEVPSAERAAYMEDVVAEFAEAFDSFGVETDTYVVGGWSEFSAEPASATFVEVVRAEHEVPPEAWRELRAYWAETAFCEDAEATMFTDQGWSYSFSFRNANGRVMVSSECRPDGAAAGGAVS